VGFRGALLVIQPSLTAFGLVAFLPLLTAVPCAFDVPQTRAIAQDLHPVTVQAATSVTGVALIAPVLALAQGSGQAAPDPVMPQGADWLWLAMVGSFAAISHACVTLALKFAPTSTLAPLGSFEIVSSVILGYAVFGDFPDGLTWAGIAIINSGAGLSVIHRERLAAARRRAATPA
jgi:drug/metabolite transporter (DMT)-like permease